MKPAKPLDNQIAEGFSWLLSPGQGVKALAFRVNHQGKVSQKRLLNASVVTEVEHGTLREFRQKLANMNGVLNEETSEQTEGAVGNA